MSKELNKFKDILYDSFNSIELEKNESKGMLVVSYIIDNKTKEINCLQHSDGNKLDLVEVLILLLRDKKDLEIQQLFEAVKEFI